MGYEIRSIIKSMINEIVFSGSGSNDFNWRYSQSINKPPKNKTYKKLHIYTFVTPKYKYIVHLEEYDYDLFIISFFPKLNKDFYVKQAKLASMGQKYYDEYSYKTNENMALRIIKLLIDKMKEIVEKIPKASFAYFGAPDEKYGQETDLFLTQRVRIYNRILGQEFRETHKLFSVKDFSGAALLNKEMLEEYPEIKDYSIKILMDHL